MDHTILYSCTLPSPVANHRRLPNQRMRRSRAHPDPVSCQSCRIKKLKCNRVQPCSNCAARGIACSFLVPPRQPETSATDSDIIERLQRLESLVLPNYASSLDRQPAATSAPTPISDETISSHNHQSYDIALNRLENIATKEGPLVSLSQTSKTSQVELIIV